MKSSELQLQELIEFSDGLINLKGRRLVLHSIHAFAQFRKDLIANVGDEHARRIITRFGFIWGKVDAAAMGRIFKWENNYELLKAGVRMHAIQGVTNVEIKSLNIEEDIKSFSMEVNWFNSTEAEEHLLEFGKAEESICWSLTGYASGYASECLGMDIYFTRAADRYRVRIRSNSNPIITLPD